MAQEVLTTRIDIRVAGSEEGRKALRSFNTGLEAFKKQSKEALRAVEQMGTKSGTAYRQMLADIRALDLEKGKELTTTLAMVNALDKVAAARRTGTVAQRQEEAAQRKRITLQAQLVRMGVTATNITDKTSAAKIRLIQVMHKEQKAEKARAEALRKTQEETSKLEQRSRRLARAFEWLSRRSLRLHGITGALLAGGFGGLASTVQHVSTVMEWGQKAWDRWGKAGLVAFSSIGVAAAAIIAQFAVMTAGVGALVAQVNRLDQVARTNPILPFLEQQRIANAEQLARLGPGEASRSLRYLQSSAARALAGDERRAGAFAGLGLDARHIAETQSLEDLLKVLRKIREVSLVNPSQANVLLQTIAGGEQYRAAEIQNLAARADLLEQGFEKLPLAETREQLEAIPRALNEIGLGFQRIFVVIGLGQNGVLTPLLRWLAHFLEMTALWLHQNPILAKFIGIVLVGAMAALTVAVVALAAGWIKAGIAALWAKAIMHKGLIGIGLAVAGTAILLSQISSASRQATNIVGAVGQGARQYGTPAIGSAAFRGARYVGNQAAQRIPVTQNNEITIMGVSDPREAADMVGDRLLADMELAQGR